MIIRYWWQVIKKGFWDSLALLGWSHPSRAVVSFAIFVVAVVIVRAIGGATQMEDEITWGIAIGASAVFFFGSIFLMNLLFAPARIDKEHSEKITKLQGEVAKHKASKVISDGFANLYETLSSLMAEKITDTEQFKDWDKRKKNWWNSTTSYIGKNISLSEAVLFSSVITSTKTGEKITFANEHNEAHHKELAMLLVLSKKLQTIMTF